MTQELAELVLNRIGQDFDGEAHFTEAEARQIALSLSAAYERGQVEQWQSIETAPKDGHFLVWSKHWPHQHVATRSKDGRSIETSLLGMTCWPTAGFGHPATHWQPLSPPPAIRSLPIAGKDGA